MLCGHSSGSHLAACALTRTDGVKQALLVSGIYDLLPVRLSARNEYVRLDEKLEHEYSPIRHADRVGCPVTLAWAEHEAAARRGLARHRLRRGLRPAAGRRPRSNPFPCQTNQIRGRACRNRRKQPRIHRKDHVRPPSDGYYKCTTSNKEVILRCFRTPDAIIGSHLRSDYGTL